MKERNYLMSNIKAFLIFTVVFGHFLELNGSNEAIDFIKIYIYLFHMPAFIFISGYFSKDPGKCQKKAFCSYFIPFLFMTFIYCFFYPFLTGGSITFRLVNPVFAAWYVLTIFFYKVFLKYILKIKYILPISIVCSLVAGIFEFIGKDFSLSRVIAFLPIFLLGYYCTPEMIERMRKVKKRVPAAILILIGIGLFVFNHFFQISYKVTLHAEPYHDIGIGNVEGIVIRFITLSLALVFIITFLMLFSDKQNKLTYIGDNTMAVYALHGIVYVYCKHQGVFDNFTTLTGIIVALLATIPVVFILSYPKVNQIYMKGINLFVNLENKKLYGKKKHVEEKTA